jgi:hypothetical protein
MTGSPPIHSYINKTIHVTLFALAVDHTPKWLNICINVKKQKHKKTRAMELDEYLLALIKRKTYIHIVETVEYKLSLTLNNPYKKK